MTASDGQANALQLQQAVHERQCEVEDANERLQQGQPPTEEVCVSIRLCHVSDLFCYFSSSVTLLHYLF